MTLLAPYYQNQILYIILIKSEIESNAEFIECFHSVVEMVGFGRGLLETPSGS